MRLEPPLLVLGFALLLAFVVWPVQGQTRQADLKERRISIKMERQSLSKVVGYLMEKYDVPIGFEESVIDRPHADYFFHTNLPFSATRKIQMGNGEVSAEVEAETTWVAKDHFITLDIENGRLSKVLDRIVVQMRYYKWEVNEGVVNIFPKEGRDPRFAELMRSKVPIFTLTAGKTVEDITIRLKHLPTFDRWLRRNNLRFNGVRSGVSFVLDAQYGRKLDFGMTFNDLTFRELLNEITKRKRGGWILLWKSRAANGDEHIDLDI